MIPALGGQRPKLHRETLCPKASPTHQTKQNRGRKVAKSAKRFLGMHEDLDSDLSTHAEHQVQGDGDKSIPGLAASQPS